jgi:hypothetical protein
MDEARRRTVVRGAAVVGGAAVVSAAAITGGLLWAKHGPAVEAAPTDAYPQPPACTSVPSATVEGAVPAAVLEAETVGPLPLSAGRSCVWSSLDASGEDPRMLIVSFRAHFSDSQSSGEERAAAELDALAEGELSRGDTLVRPAGVGEGAEAATRERNLTIRVWYGGADAGEKVAAIAAEVAAAL